MKSEDLLVQHNIIEELSKLPDRHSDQKNLIVIIKPKIKNVAKNIELNCRSLHIKGFIKKNKEECTLTDAGYDAVQLSVIHLEYFDKLEDEKLFNAQVKATWLTVAFALFTVIIMFWQGCMQQQELQRPSKQCQCSTAK